MFLARPSLAWKIATANILLALFAVLLAGMLQYRKERRILAATMRQELTQVVTGGALLIEGEKAEDLAADRTPAAAAITQILRSLLIASPAVDRVYVLGRGAGGNPRFLLGQGVMTDANPGSVVSAQVRDCLEHGGPITTSVYEDSEGRWFSAFHPRYYDNRPPGEWIDRAELRYGRQAEA